ncbi:2538_t:CDS:2, partial [Acaulospora morrowiae]
EMEEIKYKYVIYQKSWKGTYVDFEGDGPRHNRTLNTTLNDQYDIWTNSSKHVIYSLKDFAFVDVIYSTINSKNIKDKIMQYQSLRKSQPNITAAATNFEFIYNCLLDAKRKEQRLFLCVLLAYCVTQKNNSHQNMLPPHFQSADLIEILENVQQDTLPSDVLGIMAPVISVLVQHCIRYRSFEWIKLFKSAHILDPHYTFVDIITRTTFNGELNEFFNHWKKYAKPYIKGINEKAYVKLSIWLINMCNTMQTLFAVWKDIDHSSMVDQNIRKYFLERIKLNIRQDDPNGLFNNFNRVPADLQEEASEFFKARVLELLSVRLCEWTESNLKSIENLLLDKKMKWKREQSLKALENISRSKDLNLLDIFVKLLSVWLKGANFSDNKNPKIPIICKSWFESVLARLNDSISDEGKFVSRIFEYLSQIYSLIGERRNLYNELANIASMRVKQCSEVRILQATASVFSLNENVVNQFVEIAQGQLKQSVVAADEQLVEKIKCICGKPKPKELNVQNKLCERLLCYIMTELQKRFTPPSTFEHHLDLLKSRKFWQLIFNAKGQVSALQTHPHVQQIRVAISQLANMVAEKTIAIQLLQSILKYNDDELSTYFDHSSTKKKLTNVTVSKSDIVAIRKQCQAYEFTLNELRVYYEVFCPISKVSDVNGYISNIDSESKRLFQITLKDTLSPDHWEFHKDTMGMAKKAFKFAGSRTFANVFDKHINDETEILTVEIVSNKILPATFDEYIQLCKQYKGKDWEKLKCTEASYLWKGVVDVGAELELMGEFVRLDKNQKNFVSTLERLASVPEWIKRLEQLVTIVEIFKVPHNQSNNDWLTKSRQILQDDILTLGKLHSFFDVLNNHVTLIDNENNWPLIKELSEAGEFLEFLQTIAEHDIKNLINGVDDFNDERLNQEDTVASLIQVQQILLQLMNKAEKLTIKKFLAELAAINNSNPTLASKITLCSSCNMALQNMYKNISNRGEVTKEKIKNA